MTLVAKKNNKKDEYENKRKELAMDQESFSGISTGLKARDRLILEREIIVHPTTLLSITDHYTRAAKGVSRRVVGALLGTISQTTVRITNSFAVPFDEDTKDPLVWYLDHDYLERMMYMFKKINATERIVGWYSTSSSLRESDIAIHEFMRQYCSDPLYVMVDLDKLKSEHPSQLTLPVSAHLAFETPSQNRTFVHVPISIGFLEAEEVGVEHLLRDLQTANTATVSSRIRDKINALGTLAVKCEEIASYLNDVADGKMPMNSQLLIAIQETGNCNEEFIDQQEVLRAFQVASNDAQLVSYVGFVGRLIMALHALIRNTVQNREKDSTKTRSIIEQKTTMEESNNKEESNNNKEESNNAQESNNTNEP